MGEYQASFKEDGRTKRKERWTEKDRQGGMKKNTRQAGRVKTRRTKKKGTASGRKEGRI